MAAGWPAAFFTAKKKPKRVICTTCSYSFWAYFSHEIDTSLLWAKQQPRGLLYRAGTGAAVAERTSPSPVLPGSRGQRRGGDGRTTLFPCRSPSRRKDSTETLVKYWRRGGEAAGGCRVEPRRGRRPPPGPGGGRRVGPPFPASPAARRSAERRAGQCRGGG